MDGVLPGIVLQPDRLVTTWFRDPDLIDDARGNGEDGGPHPSLMRARGHRSERRGLPERTFRDPRTLDFRGGCLRDLAHGGAQAMYWTRAEGSRVPTHLVYRSGVRRRRGATPACRRRPGLRAASRRFANETTRMSAPADLLVHRRRPDEGVLVSHPDGTSFLPCRPLPGHRSRWPSGHHLRLRARTSQRLSRGAGSGST